MLDPSTLLRMSVEFTVGSQEGRQMLDPSTLLRMSGGFTVGS